VIAVVERDRAGAMHGTVCNGAAAFRSPSAFTVDSWAMRPSAMIERKSGHTAIGRGQELRQVLISAGSGLFCGGTQCTALPIGNRPGATHRQAAPDRCPGKAIFQQGGIEQVTGVVAGKGAPGAIGPLHPRGEAHDQQLSSGIPERRHWRIEPVRFTRADLRAKIGKAAGRGAVAVGYGRRESGAASIYDIAFSIEVDTRFVSGKRVTTTKQSPVLIPERALVSALDHSIVEVSSRGGQGVRSMVVSALLEPGSGSRTGFALLL